MHLRVLALAAHELDVLLAPLGGEPEKELDAITRSHVDEIDDALKRKEAELLEV
jgi:ribosome recycling factor